MYSFILLFSIVILFVESEPFPETQWKALCDIHALLDEKMDWWCKSPDSGYCSWKGVTCDESMAVIYLIVRNSFISGPIPDSISNLYYLEVLSLSGGEISGIPDSFAKLVNLEDLTLSEGNISSLPSAAFSTFAKIRSLEISSFNKIKEFPEFIMDYKNLESLDLSELPLVSIPSEIGELSNLKTFVTSDTKFTSLPESISKLSKLETIRFECSQLKTFPKAMKNLTKLTTLDLSCETFYHREWSNTITTDFSFLEGLTSLETLNLDSNNISAVLPDSIPESLYTISLNDCKSLNGNFPDWQGGELSKLSLDKNQLSGLIPPGICREDLEGTIGCSAKGNTWLNCNSDFFSCCGIQCSGPSMN